jgi:hypothetical protein
VLLRGTSVGRDTTNNKRKYGKQVLTTARQQSPWHKPIIFTLKDEEEVTYPYKDAFIIYMVLTNYRVHRELVDVKNFVNILSRDVMTQMRIDPSR